MDAIAAGAQSGTLTYGSTTASATFAMTTTLGGTGGKPIVTYSVTSGLPTGATAPPVTGSGGSSQNATLTVSISATTLAGSYTLNISGTDGLTPRTTTATLIVSKRSLNFTGTKVYDAGTTFTTAQVTAGNVVNSDVIGLGGSATVSSKNVGSYTSFSSNSFTTTNANYLVTGGTVAVSITTKAITVTAVTNIKTYDGTTSAAATPTTPGGSILTGDVANFTEAYSNKNAGAGKSLVPSGTVTDGNSGNNYAYTFVNR